MREIISKSFFLDFISSMKDNTYRTVYIETKTTDTHTFYDKYIIKKLSHVVEQKIKK